MNPAGKPPDRTTITERVAQLLGEQPWPAYDEQSADAIASGLDRADADSARQVRSYERDHKDRSDVVQAAERRIERGEFATRKQDVPSSPRGVPTASGSPLRSDVI